MSTVAMPKSVFSKRKAFWVGMLVAAVSIVLWWGLDQGNEAWEYDLPDWIFFPLFSAIVLIYPLVALIILYRRLPYPLLGLTYACGFGVGWHVMMWSLQTAEYGLWKGFRPEERSALNFLWRQVSYFVPTVAICVVLGMAVWGLCRLLRGRFS